MHAEIIYWSLFADSLLKKIRIFSKSTFKKRCAPRIKQEEDHGMEVVFSATTISGENSLPILNPNTTNDETINQEELKRINKEIEMLNEIEENKDSINFCMKEEETTE